MNTEFATLCDPEKIFKDIKANVMRDLGDLYRKTARLDEAENALFRVGVFLNQAKN